MRLDEIEIAKAAKEAEEIILEQLKVVKEYTFSTVFKKKMRQLVKHEKYCRTNALKRRIAIAFIIISMVAGITVSVEAVRIRVIEFITEVFDKFTSITYQKNEEMMSHDSQKDYLPQYIPQGFVLSEQERIFNDVHYIYQNELEQEILLHQLEIDVNNMIIDTEGTRAEECVLEGKHIYYYENKGIKNVMWIQESYQFIISSEIEKSELIKMSLSLE